MRDKGGEGTALKYFMPIPVKIKPKKRTWRDKLEDWKIKRELKRRKL
jgi:hypothetical protein